MLNICCMLCKRFSAFYLDSSHIGYCKNMYVVQKCVCVCGGVVSLDAV